MLQALDLMEKMAGLIGVLNDRAPLTAHFTAMAQSEAEVNAVAEMMGVTAKWAHADYYRAELRAGGVAFTVGFLTPPSADLDTLGAVRGMTVMSRTVAAARPGGGGVSARRSTGEMERSIADDIRDMDPKSWPYGNQVPPAQVALQEERRRQAQSGPQPRFIPTGPMQRLAVTGAQPQAPGPETLQASEDPAGTFTARSPWQQWAQAGAGPAVPRPRAGRPRSTTGSSATGRAACWRRSPRAAEPYTLAPPVHESWRARQAVMSCCRCPAARLLPALHDGG